MRPANTRVPFYTAKTTQLPDLPARPAGLSKHRRFLGPNRLRYKETIGPGADGIPVAHIPFHRLDHLSEAQTEQTFRNIEAALREAGASLKDVVRVTYIVPNAAEFDQCWPVLRKYLGDVRPASTMLSAGLIDPRIRIEIEVTARRRV